jgi:hypothetical protein
MSVLYVPRACLTLEQFFYSSPGIFILVRSARFQDQYSRLRHPGEWSLEVTPCKQQRPIIYAKVERQAFKHKRYFLSCMFHLHDSILIPSVASWL